MLRQLLAFFFSFLLVMASGPLLLLLADRIWHVQIDAFFARSPAGVSLIISLYLFLVSYAFFKLQDLLIVFSPPAGSAPVSRQELLSRLERAFTAPVDGNRLFDFKQSGNRVVITWSSSVSYFQGTSGGTSGMKRVVVLNLNERTHEVFFLMKDKDYRWNLSQNFAEFSLNYSEGLTAEFRTEVHPSIEFGKQGLRIDMKKLRYSSEELWAPIQAAVLASGWTLRGGMLPNVFHRIILCLSLAVTVFLLLFGMMAVLKKPPEHVLKTPAPPPAAEWKQPGTAQIVSEFEKITATMTTEQLRKDIEIRQRMPVEYLIKGGDATVYAVYARTYLARPDRDERFAAALRRFADEHNLDFGVQGK